MYLNKLEQQQEKIGYENQKNQQYFNIHNVNIGHATQNFPDLRNLGDFDKARSPTFNPNSRNNNALSQKFSKQCMTDFHEKLDALYLSDNEFEANHVQTRALWCKCLDKLQPIAPAFQKKLSNTTSPVIQSIMMTLGKIASVGQALAEGTLASVPGIGTLALLLCSLSVTLVQAKFNANEKGDMQNMKDALTPLLEGVVALSEAITNRQNTLLQSSTTQIGNITVNNIMSAVTKKEQALIDIQNQMLEFLSQQLKVSDIILDQGVQKRTQAIDAVPEKLLRTVLSSFCPVLHLEGLINKNFIEESMQQSKQVKKQHSELNQLPSQLFSMGQKTVFGKQTKTEACKSLWNYIINLGGNNSIFVQSKDDKNVQQYAIQKTDQQHKVIKEMVTGLSIVESLQDVIRVLREKKQEYIKASILYATSDKKFKIASLPQEELVAHTVSRSGGFTYSHSLLGAFDGINLKAGDQIIIAGSNRKNTLQLTYTQEMVDWKYNPGQDLHDLAFEKEMFPHEQEGFIGKIDKHQGVKFAIIRKIN